MAIDAGAEGLGGSMGDAGGELGSRALNAAKKVRRVVFYGDFTKQVAHELAEQAWGPRKADTAQQVTGAQGQQAGQQEQQIIQERPEGI